MDKQLKDVDKYYTNLEYDKNVHVNIYIYIYI